MKTKVSTEEVELSIFEVGSLTCALNIADIQEINKHLEITRVPNACRSIRGILNMRGTIITVVDMREMLGFEYSENAEDMRLIVVKFQHESIGLLVDRIVDVVQVKPEELEPPPSNLEGIAGSYFTSIYKMDNRLAALLNIKELLEVDRSNIH